MARINDYGDMAAFHAPSKYEGESVESYAARCFILGAHEPGSPGYYSALAKARYFHALARVVPAPGPSEGDGGDV